MCTRFECERHVGKMVQFRTPYGYHQGVIERITPDNKAIVLSPKHYAPAELISGEVSSDEMERLDLALAWGGFGARPGYPGGAGAYGAAPYGGARGGYGYGGWGFGWQRWAVSFLIIYSLFGLWMW